MADSLSDRQPVEILAEEFLERLRRGERPTIEEYATQHPAIANEIRDLFPALLAMEELRPSEESVEDRTSRSRFVEPDIKRLGDFRILQEVGRGGMGIVYEAEQISLGRRVAIKVLPKHMLSDQKTRQRFEREARAAARLHHTNIVPVFGVGEHEGLPYYVMQFIHGLGLDEVLDELKKVGDDEEPEHHAATGDHQRRERAGFSAATVARSLISGQFDAVTSDAPSSGSDLEAASQRQRCVPQDGLDSNDRPNSEPTRGDDLWIKSGAVNSGGSPAASNHTEAGAVPSLDDLSEPAVKPDSSTVLGGLSHVSGVGSSRRRTYWHSVAGIGEQVASALQYAHDQGILHRDIKPSNLLLDTRGTVWVTDFGLAKANDQRDLTHTGDVLGTLRYMAPESFEGRADARSDLYSLGLTLYELLALRPAFNAEDRHQLLSDVMQGAPPRLEKVAPQVPRDLITIVNKATDRDPKHRYRSAQEVADDLRRFNNDELVQARRVSSTERFLRWSRRNKLLATLLCTSMALLLAITVGSLGFLSVLRTRQTETELFACNAICSGARIKGEARFPEYLKDAREALGLVRERGADILSKDYLREWYVSFLGDFVGLSPRVIWTPPQDVAILAHDPQSSDVAFATTSGQVTVRDLVTTTEQHLSSAPSVEPVAIAYDGTGNFLAVADKERRINVWTKDEEWKHVATVQVQCSRIYVLAFTGDSRRVILCGDTSTGLAIEECSMDGTTQVFPLPESSDLKIHDPVMDLNPSMVFSSNAGYFVMENRRMGVLVWDVERHRVLSVFDKWKSVANPLAVGGDGQFVVVGAAHGFSVVDTASPSAEVFQPGLTVEATAISAGNDRFAILNVDGRITIRDLPHRRELGTIKTPRGQVDLSAVDAKLAFVEGGRRLVLSSKARVCLWDLVTSERQVLLGHKAGVPGVAFSLDGKYLASACGDGGVRIWDTSSGRLVQHLTGMEYAETVAFSADRRLVAAGGGGIIEVWEVETGRHVQQLRTDPIEGDRMPWYEAVWSVAFSPQGHYFAAGTGEDVLLYEVHDDNTFVEVTSLTPKPANVIRGWTVAFSPDGRYLVWIECPDVADSGVPVTITGWDLRNQTPIRRNFITKIAVPIKCFTFSSDALLSLVNVDGDLVTWNVHDGLRQTPDDQWSGIAAPSVARSDSFYIERPVLLGVTASRTGKRLVVDTDTGFTVLEKRDGETNRLFTLKKFGSTWSAVWSPDGSMFAVGTAEGDLSVWRIEEIRKQLQQVDLDW